MLQENCNVINTRPQTTVRHILQSHNEAIMLPQNMSDTEGTMVQENCKCHNIIKPHSGQQLNVEHTVLQVNAG